MPNSFPRRRSGFTLVELLVVIVIIVTLASLSFLGFSRMRAAADAATTVSNMRQLQVANQSYASDHNGRYASYKVLDEDKGTYTYWTRSPGFLSYIMGDESVASRALKDITVPLGILDPVVVRSKARYYDGLWASYGMNSGFMKEGGKSASGQQKELYVSAPNLIDPSRTAAFVNATDVGINYDNRNLWWNSPEEGKSTNGKMAFRHNNKAVVVYFDGSSGFITRADIDRFDANGGQTNIFWKGSL